MIVANLCNFAKKSLMEAIFKLKASEIDVRIIDSIKKLFGSNDVIIQISSVNDETSYPTRSTCWIAWPANQR